MRWWMVMGNGNEDCKSLLLFLWFVLIHKIVGLKHVKVHFILVMKVIYPCSGTKTRTAYSHYIIIKPQAYDMIPCDLGIVCTSLSLHYTLTLSILDINTIWHTDTQSMIYYSKYVCVVPHLPETLCFIFMS